MHGTGLIISASGFVLTAAHLFPKVEGSTMIGVEVATENEPANRRFADVIRLDHQDDLALLQIKGSGSWPALCFGDSAALPLEAQLYALGYTDDEQPTLTSTLGRLTNKSGRRWQTNLALNPGNSGAPVFDASGNVVGVVAGGRPGRQLISFIVPEQFSRGLRNYADAKGCPAAGSTAKSQGAQPANSHDAALEQAPADDPGSIIVPPGGRKRFSVRTGSSAELTEESIVLAVRDPDLQRNSTAVKVSGRSTRMGIGQEVDLSLYGKNRCRLSLLGVKAEAIDFLMKCQ
jgi:S1-C subfamily serine protease